MRRYQCGVSYVEFAFSFVVLMMIAFFIVDGGVVLYHYHFLTDRTATFARKISAEVATRTSAGMSCDDIAQLAQQELCLLKQEPQVAQLNLEFAEVQISQPLNSPYPVITLNGSWAVSCAACRFALPPGVRMRASSSLVLEDDKSQIPGVTCIAPGGLC